MNDEHYLKLAIQLAESARGQTSPNPLVGAVVVKDGQIVGMGAHLRAGEGHAEVHALNMAGEKAKGATIYVTLEPCSHYGKTPPCAELVVEKGIARAVIATTDPNPKVSGRGIERLKAAGINVLVGVLKEEADKLNRVFYHYIKTRKPYVTLKSATTLDGKTATVSGKSKWITGEAARKDVHRYRHEHDGILVGIGTILADNPSLTTRLEHGGNHPIRIILDRQLRLPLDATVVTDGLAPTWVFTTEHGDVSRKEALEKAGVHVHVLTDDTIGRLLSVLGEKGITSLFVEGGAEVNGSFLKERAVNRVITYFAPKLFGGANAPTAVGGEGVKEVEEALEVEIEEVTKVGDDIKVVSLVKEEVI
ncbi:bifunctional diaminohydroxyphosphoribosylaminopyrimidine deaminase/5-amino-6-(5-phosphoribosylamino)uracil reductase RibD [Halalkalibacterium ligniniphilum]|uniref:bifunctional diaminohydroxyphosphoribosylaminopyrimidine deaminase/5-amino-6-(5-phosphoribosylamino)uracil reductase RibD n=1 Tax=Halalkalibacterium ligniniphilum TaxID=1134413 RepID=UPI0003482BC4|nr:bifunctional diaminohydroxyphosphoribosylaminopyrimidine deaminase/5-amino-6-(5-phosphoribosylamino)uracil reductase RibD [Halalkalibacterium ligniniphilum]